MSSIGKKNKGHTVISVMICFQIKSYMQKMKITLKEKQIQKVSEYVNTLSVIFLHISNEFEKEMKKSI